MNTDNIQIVVLESVDTKLHQENAAYFFHSMCYMKLQGYRNLYTPTALPLDKYDYISTHLLVCEKQVRAMPKVISGYRSLSNNKCHRYKLRLDVVETVKTYGTAENLYELETFIKRSKDNDLDFAHNSRWTTLPAYSANREYRLLCLELAYLMLYHYNNSSNKNEWVSLGVNAINTDKVFYRAGGKAFKSPEFKIFSPFNQWEKVTLIHGGKNRQENKILPYVQKHQKLWDERIIV